MPTVGSLRAAISYGRGTPVLHLLRSSFPVQRPPPPSERDGVLNFRSNPVYYRGTLLIFRGVLFVGLLQGHRGWRFLMSGGPAGNDWRQHRLRTPFRRTSDESRDGRDLHRVRHRVRSRNFWNNLDGARSFRDASRVVWIGGVWVGLSGREQNRGWGGADAEIASLARARGDRYP